MVSSGTRLLLGGFKLAYWVYAFGVLGLMGFGI